MPSKSTRQHPAGGAARLWLLLCFAVVCHATVHVMVSADALNDEPLNSYSPASLDARDYARKAEVFLRDGFTAAFGDAGRVPGYSLFLALFHATSSAPHRTARLAQVVLASCIMLLAGAALRCTAGPGIAWFRGALIAGIWAPFHYFAPVLTAESVSLVLVACLCAALCRLRAGHREHLLLAAVALLLSALFYLKPNHLLLMLPIGGYLWMKSGRKSRAVLWIMAVVVGTGLLLAPWLIFVSRRAAAAGSVSCIQGEVLAAGAGLRPQCYGAESEGSLPRKIADWLDLSDMDRAMVVSRAMHGRTMKERDELGGSLAAAAWRSRPFATTAYGIGKALHAFGFSLRGFRDAVMAGQIVLALLGAAYLWRAAVHRECCVYLWLAIAMAAGQAFVFLPDQRFRVVIVDFPALLVIVLAGVRCPARGPAALVRRVRARSILLAKDLAWRYRVAIGRAAVRDEALLSDTWGQAFASRSDLAKYIVQRENPHFLVEPEQRDALVSLLRTEYPGAEERIVAAADRICRGDVSRFGDRFDGPGELDWYVDPGSGYRWDQAIYGKAVTIPVGKADIKVPWQLSRFHHLTVLGQAYWLGSDHKYSAEYARQVGDWIEKNPVGLGVNWVNAMEASIRSANWLLSFPFVAEALEPEFVFGFTKSLLEHGRFIRGNLEIYHDEDGQRATNNHYLTDVAGLVLLGLFFRDAAEGREWLEFGLAEIRRETAFQVNRDGSFFEISTSYHRFVLELLVCVCVICTRNGIEPGPELISCVDRMSGLIRDLTRPDGRMPLVGDNDNGRFWIPVGYGEQAVSDHRYLAALAATFLERSDLKEAAGDAHEAVLWYFGPAGLDRFTALQEGRGASAAAGYPDGGYFVSRAGDDYLLVTAGGIGGCGRGWHKHNDIGGFELCVAGRPIIVDAGCAAYTGDPELHKTFRSGRQHNCLVVDGQEMNRFHPSDLFRVLDDARPAVHGWETTGGCEKLIVEHRGFARFDERLVHRRIFSVQRGERRWLVEDQFVPPGTCAGRDSSVGHEFEWFLHLAPGVAAEEAGDMLYTLSTRGIEVGLRIEGMAEIVVGTETYMFSPGYGSVEQAISVVIRYAGRPLPKMCICLEAGGR